jgi:pyridoxamine 5'-phosphate oxidase
MKNTFSENPFVEFTNWLRDEGYNPESDRIDVPFVLATCSKNSIPSARVLFLKQIINKKLIFFSNKNSRKGREISENPNISMCFFFEKSEKQIRIEGKVTEAHSEISDKYFASRSALSKIASIQSLQSQPLENYEDFVKEIHEKSLLMDEKSLKRPENWVGYEVDCEVFEFWRSGEFRLNKRIIYKTSEKSLNFKKLWNVITLYP